MSDPVISKATIAWLLKKRGLSFISLDRAVALVSPLVRVVDDDRLEREVMFGRRERTEDLVRRIIVKHEDELKLAEHKYKRKDPEWLLAQLEAAHEKISELESTLAEAKRREHRL